MFRLHLDTKYWQGSSGMALSYSPGLLKRETQESSGIKLVASCGEEKSMNKESEGLVRALPLPSPVQS